MSMQPEKGIGQPEDQNRTMARIQSGELAVVPTVNRLLMTVSGAGLPALTSREFREIMADNPGMALQLIHTSYKYPGLVDVQPDPIQLRPNQEFIKENFVHTIKILDTEGNFDQVMEKAPFQVKQTIEQSHEQLGTLGIETSYGELLLRSLIQSATMRTVTLQSYPDIVAMHELYGRVAMLAFPAESIKEEDHLRSVGQSLLKRRRLIEIEASEGITDENGSRIRSLDPMNDYNGSVASLTTAKRAIDALLASDESKTSDRIKTLQEMVDAEIYHLQTHYPQRLPELRKIFVGIAGQRKFDPWAEVAGGPDFTTAERLDFGREITGSDRDYQPR